MQHDPRRTTPPPNDTAPKIEYAGKICGRIQYYAASFKVFATSQRQFPKDRAFSREVCGVLYYAAFIEDFATSFKSSLLVYTWVSM